MALYGVLAPIPGAIFGQSSLLFLQSLICIVKKGTAVLYFRNDGNKMATAKNNGLFCYSIIDGHAHRLQMSSFQDYQKIKFLKGRHPIA